MQIHGVVSIRIREKDPATGKPYLELEFPGGPTLCVTTNLGEMIGGAARGAAERYQIEKAARN